MSNKGDKIKTISGQLLGGVFLIFSGCVPIPLQLHHDYLGLLKENPTVYVVTFRTPQFEVEGQGLKDRLSDTERRCAKQLAAEIIEQTWGQINVCSDP